MICIMYVCTCTARGRPYIGGCHVGWEERPGAVHDVKLSEAANNPHLSTNIISARVQLVGMAKTKKKPPKKRPEKTNRLSVCHKVVEFYFLYYCCTTQL